MRYCLLALFLITGFAGFCSQEPVKWHILATPGSNQQYTLVVTGIIDPGWYVYAHASAPEGLDGIGMSWDHENVRAKSELLPGQEASTINDLIFNTPLKIYSGSFTLQQEIIIQGPVPANLVVTISAYAADQENFLPIQHTIPVSLAGGSASTNSLILPGVNLESPTSACGEQMNEGGTGLWSIFLKGLAGGLLALLMPCIFPMLPVTVSFFMNRAKNRQQGIRNGFLYGGFILGIYLLASLPFHLAGNVNPQIFNSISTNLWVNLAFFAIFMIFAFSLFGFFELRLPGANAAGQKSNTSSIGGIFFMALTLAIVSFSCTGPILGFLLVNSINTTGGAWALTAGMAGFGVALALPFGLFAMFPQWMTRLPKSGGWMETLKKSLAFVELALAFKFLSNADLVEHWGLLKRETFIAVWILITLGLAFYLLKKPYSKPLFTTPRGLLGILSLGLVIYLLPGLTNTKYANLEWVSGFPPPLSYSIYDKKAGNEFHVEPQVVNDYRQALELSRKTNKPLLVDFTGWACVNCRKMEENVWTQPAVAGLIRENFILVSLYVDDREKLPAAKRFYFKGKYIKTVGDQWASFQAENFGSASQPQYVILSPDETLLNHPVGYTGEDEYRAWLECGIKAFNQTKPTNAVSINGRTTIDSKSRP